MHVPYRLSVPYAWASSAAGLPLRPSETSICSRATSAQAVWILELRLHDTPAVPRRPQCLPQHEICVSKPRHQVPGHCDIFAGTARQAQPGRHAKVAVDRGEANFLTTPLAGCQVTARHSASRSGPPVPGHPVIAQVRFLSTSGKADTSESSHDRDRGMRHEAFSSLVVLAAMLRIQQSDRGRILATG